MAAVKGWWEENRSGSLKPALSYEIFHKAKDGHAMNKGFENSKAKFRIRCLVDNHALDASFRSEHGVAFIIESPAGHVLFDTGMSGEVLLDNSALMGYDLHQVDALALSHAHYDHTGGLGHFMAQSMPVLPLFAHPDIFRPRFADRDGEMRNISGKLDADELARAFTFHLSAEPVEVVSGIWTSGEIAPRKEFEGRSPTHYIQSEWGWQPDPYRDDMSLVLQGRDGLIMVCGCCHAGLLNTIATVRRRFEREITTVIGGTHLGPVAEKDLEHAIDVLRTIFKERIPVLYLNHCSGDAARARLASQFPGKVHDLPAGSVLDLE